MEIEELLDSAKKRIQVSDHFLTQSYPLIQDPKLLVNILEGIAKATEDIVDAILITERKAERIHAYHEGNFVAKLALLHGAVGQRYQLTHVDIEMLSEIQQLIHDHKASAVEFPRRGQYVMASNNFQLATLSPEKIKTYLTRAKTLLAKTHDGIQSTRRN